VGKKSAGADKPCGPSAPAGQPYDGGGARVKRPRQEKRATSEFHGRETAAPTFAPRLLASRPVAKKSKTPPPPRRPVQAPQRRSGGSRGSASGSDAGRRRLLLFGLVGVLALVAAGVAVAVVVVSGGGSSASVEATMQEAGCTIKTAPAKSRKHVTSLNAKIKYNTDPPSNGSHYYQPAIWDFYTTEAAPIQVVHNEEHGGVILWWGNKVSASTIDALRAFYEKSPNAMLGTPYPSLGDKIAITAWTAPSGGMGEGHAAVCPAFDEKAFAKFRDAYRGQGPERYPMEQLTPGM
jgi:Protein of unknown function (DUF3105)